MADGFVGKFKGLIGLGEDEEEYAEEYESESFTEKPVIESESVNMPSSNLNKVVNINKNANMKVVLYQPQVFEDSKAIVDSLKAKRPVIINIEELEEETGRKVFDFCSGALYALDGHVQKISRGIFIFAPNHIDITGNVKSELESKGIFSWT